MKRKEIYPKNHLKMKVIFKILIISISLLFASKIALADQNDPRLNNLFKKLNETENQDEIRDLISDIWNIWYEVDDPKVIEYFEKGIQAMNLRNYPLAIRFFNNNLSVSSVPVTKPGVDISFVYLRPQEAFFATLGISLYILNISPSSIPKDSIQYWYA